MTDLERSSPVVAIFRLAAPVILGRTGLVGTTVFLLAMLGEAGSAAVAAYALPMSVQSVAIVFATAAMRGLETATARNLGAGFGLGRIKTYSTLMIVAIGAASALVVLTAPTIAQAFGIDEDVTSATMAISIVFSAGMPAVCAVIAGTFVLEASRAPSLALTGALILLVSTVILWFSPLLDLLGLADDPALRGAAAITLARWVSAIAILASVWLTGGRAAHFDERGGARSSVEPSDDPNRSRSKSWRLILNIGSASIVFEILGVLGISGINFIAARQGAEVLHGYQIALNFLAMGMVVSAGFVTAGGIRVAYWYGRNEMRWVRSYIVRTLAVSQAALLAIQGVALFAPRLWIDRFSPSQDMAQLLPPALVLIASIITFENAANVQIAALRSIGDVWAAPLFKAGCMWLVAFPTLAIGEIVRYERAAFIENVFIGLLASAIALSVLTTLRLLRVLDGFSPNAGERGAA